MRLIPALREDIYERMFIHVIGAEIISDLSTPLACVKGHENDGRADRLIDHGLGQDRLHRRSHEAAVEPFVPEGGKTIFNFML